MTSVHQYFYRHNACWLAPSYEWIFRAIVLLFMSFNIVTIYFSIIKSCGKINPNETFVRHMTEIIQMTILLEFVVGITCIVGFFSDLAFELKYLILALNAFVGVMIMVLEIISWKKIKAVIEGKFLLIRIFILHPQFQISSILLVITMSG